MPFEAEQFLTEVLGAGRISQRGDELQHACLLPWGPHEHDDQTPGASLNAEKRLYNCFKCGTGGTLLWATETILGVTAAEARKLIQGTFEPDEISPESFLQQIEQGWQVMGESAMPHYSMKVVQKWACPTKYLDNRGISREVQREMLTGLNKTNVDKFGGEAIVQPRIVFPHVFKGVLRGWTSRLIDPRQVGNKYDHTSQFPKKTTLYNYDGAKLADSVIVVESPMSVLWLKTHGIHNAVATFGAEVNSGQAALMKKWDTVILFPDGDSAGYRALRRDDQKHEGRTYGILDDLANHPDVRLVDHGIVGWEGERPVFNEKDPANYSGEEIIALINDAIPASTVHFSYPVDDRKKRVASAAMNSAEDWN